MGKQARHDRRDILAKAQALFWRKGYHATSLKDLEAALDMHPGSIYAAFGSKEALFGETLQLYSKQSRELLRRNLEAASSPLAGLAAHIRDIGCTNRSSVPSRACMLVKTLLEMPDDDPVLRQRTEEMMNHLEADLAAAFTAAQAVGQLAETAEPHLLASKLQAEIMGLRAYAQRTGTDDRVNQMAEDMARKIEALAIH